MIKAHPSDAEISQYAYNIMGAWHSASDDQLHRGLVWYQVAHDLATMISDGDTVAGAGVLAALSANKSWPENVRLARRAFDTGQPSGHVGDAVGKAARILAGESPESVLPMARKTGNFYRLIANPSDPTAVVVDRHAHDVAVGEVYGSADRGLSVQSRYDALASAYRLAAHRLGRGVTPAQVQAVTWVAQVDGLAGVGTRGMKATREVF